MTPSRLPPSRIHEGLKRFIPTNRPSLRGRLRRVALTLLACATIWKGLSLLTRILVLVAILLTAASAGATTLPELCESQAVPILGATSTEINAHDVLVIESPGVVLIYEYSANHHTVLPIPTFYRLETSGGVREFVAVLLDCEHFEEIPLDSEFTLLRCDQGGCP